MINSSFKSYARGKLLLTGEYFVLDGAQALAVPTVLGQHFSVEAVDGPKGHIDWMSLDNDGEVWFRGRFLNVDGFEVVKSSEVSISNRICQLLNEAGNLKPSLLHCPSIQIVTKLEFPVSWGLGSSSTLVYSIAEWLNIDSYDLLRNTFGGSGYDLACAAANGPVFYRRQKTSAQVIPVAINWTFKEHLYFVFLEKKQDSREGIGHYNSRSFDDKIQLQKQLSELGERLIDVSNIAEFCLIVNEHEEIIANALDLAKVKEKLFKDFNGSIKSLGAWGGDFILVATEESPENTIRYFTKRGYSTVIPWNELILESKNYSAGEQ